MITKPERNFIDQIAWDNEFTVSGNKSETARDNVRVGEPKEGTVIRDVSTKPKTVSIIDFFDPTDIRHLSAYQHLCETGFWPDNFVPENIEFPSAWYMHLDSKIAKHFVVEKLNIIKNHLANVKVETKVRN